MAKLMSITEFLEARIAEDEARAKACTSGGYDLEWRMEGTVVYPLYQMTDGSPNEGNWIPEEHADFIVTNDPSRVLAECTAKRAIIENIPKAGDVFDARGGTSEYVLRCLATVYADHPDYRQEWT